MKKHRQQYYPQVESHRTRYNRIGGNSLPKDQFGVVVDTSNQPPAIPTIRYGDIINRHQTGLPLATTQITSILPTTNNNAPIANDVNSPPSTTTGTTTSSLTLDTTTATSTTTTSAPSPIINSIPINTGHSLSDFKKLPNAKLYNNSREFLQLMSVELCVPPHSLPQQENSTADITQVRQFLKGSNLETLSRIQYGELIKIESSLVQSIEQWVVETLLEINNQIEFGPSAAFNKDGTDGIGSRNDNSDEFSDYDTSDEEDNASFKSTTITPTTINLNDSNTAKTIERQIGLARADNLNNASIKALLTKILGLHNNVSLFQVVQLLVKFFLYHVDPHTPTPHHTATPSDEHNSDAAMDQSATALETIIIANANAIVLDPSKLGLNAQGLDSSSIVKILSLIVPVTTGQVPPRGNYTASIPSHIPKHLVYYKHCQDNVKNIQNIIQTERNLTGYQDVHSYYTGLAANNDEAVVDIDDGGEVDHSTTAATTAAADRTLRYTHQSKMKDLLASLPEMPCQREANAIKLMNGGADSITSPTTFVASSEPAVPIIMSAAPVAKINNFGRSILAPYEPTESNLFGPTNGLRVQNAKSGIFLSNTSLWCGTIPQDYTPAVENDLLNDDDGDNDDDDDNSDNDEEKKDEANAEEKKETSGEDNKDEAKNKNDSESTTDKGSNSTDTTTTTTDSNSNAVDSSNASVTTSATPTATTTNTTNPSPDSPSSNSNSEVPTTPAPPAPAAQAKTKDPHFIVLSFFMVPCHSNNSYQGWSMAAFHNYEKLELGLQLSHSFIDWRQQPWVFGATAHNMANFGEIYVRKVILWGTNHDQYSLLNKWVVDGYDDLESCPITKTDMNRFWSSRRKDLLKEEPQQPQPQP